MCKTTTKNTPLSTPSHVMHCHEGIKPSDIAFSQSSLYSGWCPVCSGDLFNDIQHKVWYCLSCGLVLPHGCLADLERTPGEVAVSKKREASYASDITG